METITMKLNSPITDEQWNIITDAELERSDEIEFTTPSGKKVMYAKVRRGKWEVHEAFGYMDMTCSVCGWLYDYNFGLEREWKFCPHCGAKMDEVNDDK